MTIRTVNLDPPAKAPVVDGERDITGVWLVYFNSIARQLERRIVADFPDTDPPSIAAGAVTQVTATVPGIDETSFCLAATFDPGDPGITVHGQVTAENTVTVTFRNVSGAPIDLPSGTLYLRLEAR